MRKSYTITLEMEGPEAELKTSIGKIGVAIATTKGTEVVEIKVFIKSKGLFGSAFFWKRSRWMKKTGGFDDE